MLLNETDHIRVREATRAAEATTRGEIVCVVADEASHYMEVPLAWGAATALVLPVAMLALGLTADWLGDALAGWSAGQVAASRSTVMAALGGYALGQCLLFICVALLVSIPMIRRALTPAFIRRGHVHQRAMEQFYARSLHAARDHAGVLIYASLKDRMAEVIADTGIDAKVGPRAWDEAIHLLTREIRAGRPGDGFVGAIDMCGRLLAAHFPPDGAIHGELSDDLVEAGASEKTPLR